MKKKLVALSIATISLLLIPQAVQAHVLIRDDSKQIGAVLHINPDDDPIAGQPTSLFFDIQSQALKNGNYTAMLQITDSTGQKAIVQATVNGSAAIANYTFPVQGAYTLKLTIVSGADTYVFNHSQRVARGTAASALDKPNYAWAEMALVACGSLFLLLLIVAFNRRKEIASQSKF